MSNIRFAGVVCGLVAVCLGAAAFHYNMQVSPTVKPLVLVYRDSTHLEGRDRQPDARLWTLAVRSDGSFMRANSIGDASGHIEDVKSIEFRDRYVVVDPYTASTTTYKPSMAIFVPTRDCLGTSAGSMLGHPLEYLRDDSKKAKGNVIQMTTERWLAADLNCVVMREHISEVDRDHGKIEFYREAVSVRLGEPPADFFEVPPSYHERGPADLSKELESKSGQKVFRDDAARDKLQKIYDAEKHR